MTRTEPTKENMKNNYLSGFRVGKKWASNYRPGGPYSRCDDTRALREEWLRGFDNGLAANTK
jgi:hypothetical protein